ncbi:MAG: primosomal protein N' [Bacteroidales bacterium]|nr:primosomal protein N' [Candidatus Sodaliphilus fimicaballi]
MPQFAEVLLPLSIQGSYTYHIPPTMVLSVGSRVLVPFGRKKIYTAIVSMLHDIAPKGYEVKDILSVLDPYPIVRHPQLKFWDWLSDYYLCTPGEVYKAAVPSGLKVESETFISPNPDFEEEVPGTLSDKEKVVLDFTTQRGRIQIADISNATGFKNVEGVVSKLLDMGAIHVSERVVDNYRPRTEACVTLTIDQNDDEALNRFFDEVKRARKQEQLILAYLDMSHWMSKGKKPLEVTKESLLKRAGVSAAVLSAAVARGIFSIYKKEINRFDTLADNLINPPTLTEEQKRAYGEIHRSFIDKDITLLHGVTSSGKTSIYMHLIKDVLEQGKQALYLVPEIALTTQLTRRLKAVFGNKLLIYHSKFSDNERVDIWRKLLLSNEPCVVIGVRSSVFLPFSKLGIIIVDEEHDSSYKQQDPAPRYNGRNAAIILASMHGAKTLLGSATPAIEVYYRAQKGQYGFVELLTRYEGIQMPEVKVIDTKVARKKHEMRGMFSGELVYDCGKALTNGEQVILFQNRRGYAPMVRCKECGVVPQCENCDVSLTYHKHTRSLSCHYCGFPMTLNDLCPACGLPGIQVVGYGTEPIEDDIDKVFPDEKISRMDLDTTRSKAAYDRIIDEFSAHKTNILVGTQMVTKGLDFDGVSIVGILNADTMIRFPDFRSHERAFDMMEQVAGRAGRAHKQGHVVIQTSEPDHPVIGYVKNHDYKGFYEEELAEREQFMYPPFSRIINIYLKHRDNGVCMEMAVRLSNMLRQVFGQRVLGPEAPLVGRVQNMFIQQIVLKMEMQASMPKVKKILRDTYERMVAADSRMKSVRLYYDVDPV